MKPDKKYTTVIAYFHYDSQRSDIEKFVDEDSAKQWLYEKWGFLMEGESPSSLKELIYLLQNEYGVTIEILTI